MAATSFPYLFPFCIEDVDPPPSYLPALTLEEMMMVFWRVREWTLDVHRDAYDSYPDYDHSEDFEVTPVTPIFDPPTEKDLSCGLSVHAVYEDDGGFYPESPGAINIGLVLYSDDYGGDRILESSGSYYPNVVGFIETQLIGETYSWDGSKFSVSGGDWYMTLTPKTWWAYNPGSGGDVYNTSTGAQLRDPFSIQP